MRKARPSSHVLALKIGLLIAFLVLCLGANGAPADDRPLAQVQSTANKIIGILNNPALQGEPNRVERHRLIRSELEVRFDWDNIARSCLGRHWQKAPPAQRQTFIDLFKTFLERVYLDRIEPYYNQLERIEYQGERILEDRFASVKSTIVTKQQIEHPVEYRLQKSSGGAWQVYDVVIEGVSLVKNYRTQFDEIINRSSFQGLLDHLRSKTAVAPIQGG